MSFSTFPVTERRSAGRAVGLGVLFVLGGSTAGFAQKDVPTAIQPKATDALESLNTASRIIYTQAKAAALAKQGPVMVVVGDDLVLRRGTERRPARVIPGIYHTLKSYSHVALAIDVALASQPDDAPLSAEFLDELRDYLELFPGAEETIAGAGLVPEQQERQRAILKESRTFLESVIEHRQCSQAERVNYTRQMTPRIMANAAEAARAAIDMLHRQVLQWKREMTHEEWRQLKVLVIGRQLPRRENLAVQYFARLLNESRVPHDPPGESDRIIYAEGLGDESRAMDLLATRQVDTQVGIDFFNDSTRMYRDLLSDGARDYLPLLLDRSQQDRRD
jgi:hypothetical protein